VRGLLDAAPAIAEAAYSRPMSPPEPVLRGVHAYSLLPGAGDQQGARVLRPIRGPAAGQEAGLEGHAPLALRLPTPSPAAVTAGLFS